MIKENLNEMIKDAMLNHEMDKLEVIRSIKTVFTNFEKEGKELTDADEIKLMNKMVSQRKDSIEQYKEGGRPDLVEKEMGELAILESFMPKQPSEDEIAEFTKAVIKTYEIEIKRKVEMRDMKTILGIVQQTYPSASGKVVSTVVKESLN